MAKEKLYRVKSGEYKGKTGFIAFAYTGDVVAFRFGSPAFWQGEINIHRVFLEPWEPEPEYTECTQGLVLTSYVCVSFGWNHFPGFFRLKKPSNAEDIFFGYLIKDDWIEMTDLRSLKSYRISFCAARDLFYPILGGMPLPAPCKAACK